jgi:hypothetical protein
MAGEGSGPNAQVFCGGRHRGPGLVGILWGRGHAGAVAPEGAGRTRHGWMPVS